MKIENLLQTVQKIVRIFLYFLTTIFALHVSIRLTAWYWVKCGMESAGAFAALGFIYLPLRLVLIILVCTGVYFLVRSMLKRNTVKLFFVHILNLTLLVLFFFGWDLWGAKDYFQDNEYCPNNSPFTKGKYLTPKCERIGGCFVDKFIFNFNYSN